MNLTGQFDTERYLRTLEDLDRRTQSPLRGNLYRAPLGEIGQARPDPAPQAFGMCVGVDQQVALAGLQFHVARADQPAVLVLNDPRISGGVERGLAPEPQELLSLRVGHADIDEAARVHQVH